jgi:putative ABC transport system permease protein
MFLKFRVSLREATRSLLGSLQRTLLALLGIVIGIASVIAMVSIGTIVKSEALRQFQDMGTDFVNIGNLAPSDGSDTGAIDLRTVSRVQAYCPSLVSMAPFTIAFSQCKFRGRTWGASVMGVTGSFARVNKLQVLKGRPINDLDQDTFNCVLGDRLTGQLRHMGIHNPVGLKVVVFDSIFTVVGCLERATDNALRPMEINDGLMIPYWTLKRITRLDKIDAIVGRMAPEATVEQATAELLKALGRVLRDRVPDINTAKALIAQMNKQMDLLALLLGVVGSIALVVGGVGVMNVMLVSVSERRREIGIRRSIGAKQGDIRSQFLIESLLLCLAGGVLGISLGVGGAWVVARFQEWTFLLTPEAIWIGFGVSALVGIFFGYYPARQASRLRIIEALRST